MAVVFLIAGANFAVDAIFGLGLLFGSISTGYLFLRIGWPNIRSLEKPYKTGWSIVAGLLFSIAVIGSTFLLGFMQVLSVGMREHFYVTLVAAFLFTALVLTVRRKFFAGAMVLVSVPKKEVSRKIAADKAMEKATLDRGFMTVGALGGERVAAMRAGLAKQRPEVRPAVGEKKPVEVKQEPKPVQMTAPKPIAVRKPLVLEGMQGSAKAVDVKDSVFKAHEERAVEKPADKAVPAARKTIGDILGRPKDAVAVKPAVVQPKFAAGKPAAMPVAPKPAPKPVAPAKPAALQPKPAAVKPANATIPKPAPADAKPTPKPVGVKPVVVKPSAAEQVLPSNSEAHGSRADPSAQKSVEEVKKEIIEKLKRLEQQGEQDG
ncbi:MAG: hypothetical protein ABH854_04120 [Candidatus Diapherotrites archaeon]